MSCLVSAGLRCRCGGFDVPRARWLACVAVRLPPTPRRPARYRPWEGVVRKVLSACRGMRPQFAPPAASIA